MKDVSHNIFATKLHKSANPSQFKSLKLHYKSILHHLQNAKVTTRYYWHTQLNSPDLRPNNTERPTHALALTRTRQI